MVDRGGRSIDVPTTLHPGSLFPESVRVGVEGGTEVPTLRKLRI